MQLALGSPVWVGEVGQGDLQQSLPTSTILWLCEMCLSMGMISLFSFLSYGLSLLLCLCYRTDAVERNHVTSELLELLGQICYTELSQESLIWAKQRASCGFLQDKVLSLKVKSICVFNPFLVPCHTQGNSLWHSRLCDQLKPPSSVSVAGFVKKEREKSSRELEAWEDEDPSWPEINKNWYPRAPSHWFPFRLLKSFIWRRKSLVYSFHITWVFH